VVLDLGERQFFAQLVALAAVAGEIDRAMKIADELRDVSSASSARLERLRSRRRDR
jgi:hypothetical protein